MHEMVFLRKAKSTYVYVCETELKVLCQYVRDSCG